MLMQTRLEISSSMFSNSGFDSDTFFIRVNAMPTSWQYKFYDNDTGLELTEEGINFTT